MTTRANAAIRNEIDRGGAQLPRSIRGHLEVQLGRSLEGVRLHSHIPAVRAVGARAATVGQHIFLGPGAPEPESAPGFQLLTHEVVHAVQQRDVDARSALNQITTTTTPADPMEREAREIAAAISEGGEAGATSVTASALARQEEGTTQADPAADLIDRHTSWGVMLDEEALGLDLLNEARQGHHVLVERVLDRLGSTDRDDVSYALMHPANASDLRQLAASTSGRRLLDRLFDELTSGSVAKEEQAEADRILQAKAALITSERFEQGMRSGKIFPFRLPGLTVFDDAPISAHRRGDGFVHVKLPVRVRGVSMFNGETATLPLDVFTSGIDLPENELVGIRLYDLGGPIVYHPALFLVQLSNQTNVTILTKAVEVAGIGLSMGAGELAVLGVEGTMAARVIAWADAAATVVGTLSTIVLEHRGEIIARFGDKGREFVQHVEYVQAATAVYGFARVVYTMPKVVAGLRRTYESWRSAFAGAKELESGESAIFESASRETETVLENADNIERARTGTSSHPPEGEGAALEASAEGKATGRPTSEPNSQSGGEPDIATGKRQSSARTSGSGPAQLGESMKKIREPEQLTAERLAGRPEFAGRRFEGSADPDYDWSDDLGRTYDAMGVGARREFFDVGEFKRAIDNHLLKSNDFTVIDMTGYFDRDIAAIKQYVDSLPSTAQLRIIRIGF